MTAIELKHKLKDMPKREMLDLAEECGIVGDELNMLLDIFIFRKSLVSISAKYHICVESACKRKQGLLRKINNYYLYCDRLAKQ